MAVSMKDIAEVVGVSKMTVSRVIRNGASVSEEMRKKVLSTVKTLRYSPRIIAEPSALSNHNISFVFFNPRMDSRSNTEILTESLKGITDEIYAHNYNLSLFLFDHKHTQKMVSSRLFGSNLPAGFIFAPGVPEELTPGFDPTGFVKEADIRDVPHVVIGNAGEKIEAHRVFKNDFKGAYKAITHLLKLGHRRIGFITREPREYIGFKMRLKAYIKALQDFGVAYKKEYTRIAKGKVATVNCQPAVGELLKIQSPPTAIFAVNDYLAIKIIEILREKGMDVPGDMAVVGYDNVQAAREITPSLTTVDPHRDLVSKKATELLCKIIQNPKRYTTYQEIEVIPSLVVRHSSGGQVQE